MAKVPNHLWGMAGCILTSDTDVGAWQGVFLPVTLMWGRGRVYSYHSNTDVGAWQGVFLPQ